jgi:hypothetical protein
MLLLFYLFVRFLSKPVKQIHLAYKLLIISQLQSDVVTESLPKERVGSSQRALAVSPKSVLRLPKAHGASPQEAGVSPKSGRRATLGCLRSRLPKERSTWCFTARLSLPKERDQILNDCYEVCSLKHIHLRLGEMLFE